MRLVFLFYLSIFLHLGSEGFIKHISEKKKDAGLEEIPRHQRKPIKRELKELLKQGGTAGEISEAVGEEYRMKEIADHLGLHYSAVTQRVKRGYRG